MRILSSAAGMAAVVMIVSAGPRAQVPTATSPRAELIRAIPLRLTGEVDSNSPAVWDRVGGRDFLFVITSSAGIPKTASGRRVDLLGAAREVVIEPWPGGGIWMEGVIADVDGTWYGYYHNENVAAAECGLIDKVIPRIGAARSRDRGRTWEPLGVVLEAPPNSHSCRSPNEYFVGGVGDLSVQLDPESRYLYFFFSQYLRPAHLQGVGVARLAWADRDDPRGKTMVWSGRTWLPAVAVAGGDGDLAWKYPAPLPVFRAAESWHDNDLEADAFWGPSVHWNTHLQMYVMLLNRASDTSWAQEGIYVSYAPRLNDPRLWSTPVRLLKGGGWYPQVLGIEPAVGTDKVAGEVARLFVSGVSNHFIRFTR